MLASDPWIGKRLGKYLLTGLLGHGGMGVVYEAEDVRLKRPVAVKLLTGALAADRAALQRFLLEARAAAQLQHPNVVAVHDVGQRDGVHYLVMERIAGGSAQDLLRERGRLRWDEATQLVAGACRGLAAAHAAGLIHRDVKPANILLAPHPGPQFLPKLADFGLARAVASPRARLTQFGTVLGTPQYMSPEQARAEGVDERSDLYSLGATYFALLTGRPPFDTPDQLQALFAQCADPIPDPRALFPDIPEGCTAILRRALTKSRAERYQSAPEMLRDLEALLAPVVATTPVLPVAVPPAPPPPRPHPGRFPVIRWRWVLLATVLAGSLTGTGMLYFVLRGNWASRSSATELPAPATGPTAVAEPGTLPSGPPPITLRFRRVLGRHGPGPVRCVAFAPDSRRLATVGGDDKVRLWDLYPGTELRTFELSGELHAVTFSADGSLIAAGGLGKKVVVWDAETGEPRATLPEIAGEVESLAFSRERLLAAGTATHLQVWDLADLRHPRTRFPARQRYMVASVAFLPDGKRLVATSYAEIQGVGLFDATTGVELATAAPVPAQLTGLAVLPGGTTVLLAARSGAVLSWELSPSARPVALADVGNDASALAVAPGGRTVVLVGRWQGPIAILDLQKPSREPLRVPTGIRTTFRSAAFAPDGRLLACGGDDGTIALWDVVSLKKDAEAPPR